MPRAAVQIHSPASTLEPSDSSKGFRAMRRELTRILVTRYSTLSECVQGFVLAYLTLREWYGQILSWSCPAEGSPCLLIVRIGPTQYSQFRFSKAQYTLGEDISDEEQSKRSNKIWFLALTIVNKMQRFITVDVICTEPNQRAISSWTILSADHGFDRGEHSMTHCIQSCCYTCQHETLLRICIKEVGTYVFRHNASKFLLRSLFQSFFDNRYQCIINGLTWAEILCYHTTNKAVLPVLEMICKHAKSFLRCDGFGKHAYSFCSEKSLLDEANCRGHKFLIVG